MAKKSKDEVIRLVDWENYESPFYTKRHKLWRAHVRSFVNQHVVPNIDKWEKSRDIPPEFYRKAYKAGIYSTFYPEEYGGTPFEEGMDEEEKNKPFEEKIDPFMNIIMNEEMTRAGSAGLLGAGWIHYVAVAPILLFGNDKLKEMIAPVIRAEKFASLCISEPNAGSDVRNITCKAVKDGEGNYIVTGEKYWITGGMKSEFFITAVRTGGPGITGISLLLIPRCKGLTTTRLPLQGHDTSATAYVVFNKCKVSDVVIILARRKNYTKK